MSPKVSRPVPKPKDVPPPVQRLPEFAGEGGLQIVSYSEMDTYRQCPLKHLLTYKERWKKPVVFGGPLDKGSLWHHVMETHYGVIMRHYPKNGQPIPESKHAAILAEAWDEVRPYLFDDTLGKSDSVQDLIRWMYEGYVEKWGVDNDWKVIAIEYPFELQLPDADGNPSQYAMKGKIDLLVQSRSNGGFWIVDHKSGAELPTSMSLEIDDQFGGYAWAMNKLGYRVRGAIHNAARTKQNVGDLASDEERAANKAIKKQTLEQRFSRTPLNRDKVEQEYVARDFWAAASNAYPLPGRELPLYSSPDPRSCSWKCDIKEVHLIARTGRDIHEVLREFRFEQNFTRH